MYYYLLSVFVVKRNNKSPTAPTLLEAVGDSNLSAFYCVSQAASSSVWDNTAIGS